MSLLRYKQKLLPYGNAMGGDGGGGSSAPAPQPTNTTVQNTNIPEYARPYVETMLGTAQQQIFNYDSNGNVTSMKPYVPYSNNPTDYVAGFSPLQQQAQSNIANMQTPGQYATGTDYATTSGLGALSTANSGAGYGGMGAQAGLLGMQQGLSYGQNATDPNAVSAYMNPYLQNALAPSLQLQNQQFGQLNAQNQGQATQQGAFGGGRQAVMQGLNQQNQMLAQNQLVGNAYNQAYNTANQNMQAASQLGMQGTAQAMQGAGLGLQGTAAQQAAYQQLGAQGANLANIAGQQTQSQLGINAAQQASGAAQQAQQQNIINQQVQNYATGQQYPMLQLANMSNLLRGLPMQSATTQTYQAAPSAVSQLGGLGATALGAYGAAGGFRNAKEGGLMQSYAAGGQVAFDVGGAVEADLENMDIPHLIQEAKNSPSATVRQEAIRILTEKQAEAAMAKGVGAAPSGMQMAGGGIVAFAGEEGSLVEEAPKLTEKEMEQARYGRLPAGSVERLTPKKDLGNYADSSNAMGEAIPSNASEGSFSKWWKEHTYGTRENLGLPVAETTPIKQAAALPPASTGAKPDALGRYPAAPISGAPTSGLGATPQAGNVPTTTGELTGYEAEIKKRLGMMDEGLGNTKAQADLDALRKEIGAGKNDKLWQALMMGGLKAMGGRSPFAAVNIGEGGAEGVKSFAEASKAEREDKKLLIAQQSALDQAEYARKTGNLNALITAQTRLDAIKQHRENLKLQYANIGATKEAALSAAKIKAHGDTVVKLMAQGMDENQANDLADRLYSSNKIAALPEGVKVTKVKG
jgi:hypothetical protein